MFLSSHILSEAEALCDRVGILREGRLVDEGTLEQLRHLHAQTIDVTFGAAVPELGSLEGVTATPIGENVMRYEIAGDVGPLLDHLGGRHVIAILAREPSLEEVFLHHYGAP